MVKRTFETGNSDDIYTIGSNGVVQWRTRHEFPSGDANPTIGGTQIGSGGETTWLGLSDTPESFTEYGIPIADEDGLDFDDNLSFDGRILKVGLQGSNDYGAQLMCDVIGILGDGWCPIVYRLSNQSGVQITSFNLVNLDPNGFGRVRLANATGAIRAHGIALESIPNGSTGRIALGICLIFDPDITVGSGYAAGGDIYLKNTAGNKDPAAPAVPFNLIQRVGKVIGSQMAIYNFDFGEDELVPLPGG